MTTPPAAVLIKDAEGAFASDGEFDDALWLSVCDQVGSVEDLRSLPSVIRTYFASRYVEWEVGNGGFAQAVLNIPEYLEPAAQAFEILGKPKVAARIREALRILEAELESLPRVSAGSQQELSDYFLDNAFNHLDQDLDDIGFWSDAERLSYVRSNRHTVVGAA